MTCIRMCLMWANVRGVYFVYTQYIYIYTHTYCWSKKNTSANSSNVQNLIVKYPTNPMIWCMNHFFPLTVSYIDHACLRTGFFFKIFTQHVVIWWPIPRPPNTAGARNFNVTRVAPAFIMLEDRDSQLLASGDLGWNQRRKTWPNSSHQGW